MRVTFIVGSLLCYIAFTTAVTPIDKCPAEIGSKSAPKEYKQVITIGNCKKVPCRLKKGRTVATEFKFTPDRDVKKLTNTVNAIIVGIPFPFIGVDGSDACAQIYEADGTTKANCPLKAGKEYTYKNKIDVLPLYPVIKTVVHWGLTSDDGKDVMCFHVRARIVN